MSQFTEARDQRAWNYVTLGDGQDEAFWCEFCNALRRAGYDDVLGIDHEDPSLDPIDGIRQSVDLLTRVLRATEHATAVES